MLSKEEFIKQYLKEFELDTGWSHHHGVTDMLSGIYDKEFSNFVNPLLGEGWQDIRIKLPYNEQVVLIAESDETIKKGYYIEEENQWYYLLDNGYYNTTEDVCFWLYIPDLPSFV